MWMINIALTSMDVDAVCFLATLLFTAATASDIDVRDGLIHGVWARAGMNLIEGPFPGFYDAWSGAIVDDAGG